MVTKISFIERSGVWHGTFTDRKDLFHLDYTYHSNQIEKLGTGSSNSQVYFFIGREKSSIIDGKIKKGSWIARTGETSETMQARWGASHRNASWYKKLDADTIIYATIYNSTKERLGWSTDFRHSLEEAFTQRFLNEGFGVENATRKHEKVEKTLDRDDRDEVFNIIEDFMGILPKLTHWQVGAKVSSIPTSTTSDDKINAPNTAVPERKKAKPINVFIEGEIFYAKRTWGDATGTRQTAYAEGIYFDGEFYLTKVTNAPYSKDYSPSGKKLFKASVLELYNNLQSTATMNPLGGYDWEGELVVKRATVPLFVAFGSPSGNAWKQKV